VPLSDDRQRSALGKAVHADTVAGLAFSADGRTLASAGRDGVVFLWDVTPAKPSRGALVRASERIAYRHAFEVRHPSYFCDEFFAILREHDCAFVIADTAGKFDYAEEVTADFVYVRLHGSSVGFCVQGRLGSTGASVHSPDNPACWRDSASCRHHR